MTRALVANSQEIVRAGIKHVLKSMSKIKVITESSNNKYEIMKKVNDSNPQIIYLGIELMDIHCFDVIKAVKRFDQKIKIIVLSNFKNDLFPAYLLQAGVMGYIQNNCKADEIVTATHTVLSGKTYLNVTVAQTLLVQKMNVESKFGFGWLSQRELQIALSIFSGKTVSQISSELYISPKTIIAYRNKLLKKINATNDVQLLLRANELGIESFSHIIDTAPRVRLATT